MVYFTFLRNFSTRQVDSGFGRAVQRPLCFVPLSSRFPPQNQYCVVFSHHIVRPFLH